jgi:hypothetical protein
LAKNALFLGVFEPNSKILFLKIIITNWGSAGCPFSLIIICENGFEAVESGLLV